MFAPDDEDKELIYVFVLVFFMVMSFVTPFCIIPVIFFVYWVCRHMDDDDDGTGDSSSESE